MILNAELFGKKLDGHYTGQREEILAATK